MAAENGNWPIEPTTLYVFAYYPTNGLNEVSTYQSQLMENYNDALAAAKSYITSQNNAGVCVIQPITCTVIYPFVSWRDF